MKYKINWDSGVFAVPDCAADGLKLATGKAVKVLLYILKFKSDNGICEYLGITEEDLEDAVSFWRNVGVFLTDEGIPAAPPPARDAEPKMTPADIGIHDKPMSAGEIADRINSSDDLKMLIDAIQSSLGRQLSFNDLASLLKIYDNLELNSEVILMLVNYCAGIGKANMSYISKIAVSWSEEGIDSSSAADAKILSLQKSKTLYEQCARQMSLNRSLTKREKELVSLWSSSGADIDLIMNAFERTVDSTGKVSFPYMNKILTQWLDNGIRTTAEADDFSEKTAPRRKTAVVGNTVRSVGSGSESFDSALSDIIEMSKTTPIIP